MRDFLLNIVAFLTAGILLIVTARNQYSRGHVAIAVIALFTAALMFWQAYENMTKFKIQNING